MLYQLLLAWCLRSFTFLNCWNCCRVLRPILKWCSLLLLSFDLLLLRLSLLFSLFSWVRCTLCVLLLLLLNILLLSLLILSYLLGISEFCLLSFPPLFLLVFSQSFLSSFLLLSLYFFLFSALLFSLYLLKVLLQLLFSLFFFSLLGEKLPSKPLACFSAQSFHSDFIAETPDFLIWWRLFLLWLWSKWSCRIHRSWCWDFCLFSKLSCILTLDSGVVFSTILASFFNLTNPLLSLALFATNFISSFLRLYWSCFDCLLLSLSLSFDWLPINGLIFRCLDLNVCEGCLWFLVLWLCRLDSNLLILFLIKVNRLSSSRLGALSL